MLRRGLLVISRSDLIKNVAANAPISRRVVARFVPGEKTSDAVRAAGELSDLGLYATIDHLGEDTLAADQANATVKAYLELLDALAADGLASRTEVSVKLSAVGQALPDVGDSFAYDNAAVICAKAHEVGTTVTLDMEDHTTTDSTLSILTQLRHDFPQTGAVVQAQLRRTEGDVRDLAYAGSRVRLCKGAYQEPETVAFTIRDEIDRAYVRCMKLLIDSPAYPMLATHDPRLIDIAGVLAVRADRAKNSMEYQMLFGIRPEEQRRLAAQGEQVRVYVPYGDQWYGYLVRRMAEKPANLALFFKSLTSRR